MTDLMRVIEEALSNELGRSDLVDDERVWGFVRPDWQQAILAALRPAVEQWLRDEVVEMLKTDARVVIKAFTDQGRNRDELDAALAKMNLKWIDAPAPLDEAAERERFERIAKARPYVWECSRSLAHEEWPGEYRLDLTQSPWEF